MSPNTIAGAIFAPAVSEILRIDTTFGYYYEAYFEGVSDFYIPFVPQQIEDGTDHWIEERLPENSSDDEVTAFWNAFAISVNPNGPDCSEWKIQPSVRVMIDEADARWKAKCVAEEDEADARWEAKCVAEKRREIWQLLLDVTDEVEGWGTREGKETVSEVWQRLRFRAHEDRESESPQLTFARLIREVEEWREVESKAWARMLALFQADMATPQYRRMEARLLRDFAYRPPAFDGGSRHNWIIREISRHVGLNPELTDQDIRYTATKLVDAVGPPFDRHRRWIEIKDGEKWGRRVRKQNQEEAKLEEAERFAQRLTMIAAILRGEKS